MWFEVFQVCDCLLSPADPFLLPHMQFETFNYDIDGGRGQLTVEVDVANESGPLISALSTRS